MIRYRVLAVTASMLLFGCSTTGVFPSQSGRAWKDADDAGVTLSRGAAECKYQAKISSAAATGVAQQSEVAGDLYEQCMRNRGY